MRIQNQHHSTETFLFASSKMLERFSFYGLRSLVIVYLMSEISMISEKNALEIVSWFAASLLLSRILGAILGDLVIGNKKAIIFGGIIRAIGTFSLCITSSTGLYFGLFLIAIGDGLYAPNITSEFGKLYLNKMKIIDSGFTIFYFAINIGSFFGVIIIGYIAEKFGWNLGFIATGSIMLLSLVPILFFKNHSIDTIETIDTIKTIKISKVSKVSMNRRIFHISITFVIVGLFWAIFDVGNIRVYDIEIILSEISTLDIPRSLWQTLDSIFIFPIGILAIILWNIFYYSQFMKLAIGFIFGVIAFGTLYLIPEIPSEKHIYIFLISLFLLSISEIHIVPIIQSTLTKFVNPKYLAIFISLSFIPSKLFIILFSLFNTDFYENSILGLQFAIIAMLIISVALTIYLLKKSLGDESIGIAEKMELNEDEIPH